MKIKKVDRRNKEDVVGWLKLNPVTHFLEIYSLISAPKKCTFWIAYNENVLKGLLSLFKENPPRIWVSGSYEAADGLLDYLPKEKIILYFQKNLTKIVKRRFPQVKIEDSSSCQMYIHRSEEKLFSSELAKKLTPENASALADLYKSVKRGELLWPPPSDEKSCKKLIKEHTVHGVFQENQLVAATVTQMFEGFQIGFVSSLFTHPQYRKGGYGTIAASKATKRILKVVEWGALFVQKTNAPAIQLYKKIGYRKVEEWWRVTIS